MYDIASANKLREIFSFKDVNNFNIAPGYINRDELISILARKQLHNIYLLLHKSIIRCIEYYQLFDVFIHKIRYQYICKTKRGIYITPQKYLPIVFVFLN